MENRILVILLSTEATLPTCIQKYFNHQMNQTYITQSFEYQSTPLVDVNVVLQSILLYEVVPLLKELPKHPRINFGLPCSQ